VLNESIPMRSLQNTISLDEDTLVNLITRAQGDFDPRAFEGLYLLFANSVFRYIVTRLGNRELAEEITSDVFVRLIEKIDLYQIAPANNVANFSAWLYRVAYNIMVDALRAGKRARQTTLDNMEESLVTSPLDLIEEEMEIDELLQELRNLSDQQHNVIVLRFIEQMSIAETAQIMQKSEGAVKALQFRALESLRRQIDR
jgi:RNA polymerase sigma-70 factor, ECF subfamily